MKNHINLSILAVICTFVFSSCASGPGHSATKASGALTPHNGKGLVLIYRTPGLMGSGTRFYVWVNETRMPGKLSRGGFYAYEAAPGPVRVEYGAHNHDNSAGENVAEVLLSGAIAMIGDSMTKDKRKLTIHASPNQTHYILMDGVRLSEVSQEEGEKDIENCHWLNPSR